MRLPTWDQFSGLFEHPGSDAVRKARASLKADYPEELDGYGDEHDYLDLFRHVFEIVIDWRQGMSSLLECLEEWLPPGEIQVEADDDDEHATVHFAGRTCEFHWPGFHHETFGEDLTALEALLRDAYVLRVFYEGGVSDSREFLVVPANLWTRAEKHHGLARMSVILKSHESVLPLDEPFDGSLRYQAPALASSPPRRLGLLVFLGVCAASSIPLMNIYNSYNRVKANQPISCERMKINVLGKLKPEQADMLIENMRERSQCI